MQTVRLATKEAEGGQSQVQDLSEPKNELFQAKPRPICHIDL